MSKQAEITLMCTLYMACSAGMSICNKLAVTAFPLVMSLVVVQMLFCDATLVTMMRKDLHFGSRADVVRWSMVIPPLFAGMLVTSMLAFQTNSLSTVVVCRNVAPLVTIFIEGAVQGERQACKPQAIAALLAVVGGVAIYEIGDMKGRQTGGSSVGFFWMLVNMTFAVMDRLAQRHMLARRPVDISKKGLLLLNNSVGALFLIILALAMGEVGMVRHAVENMSGLDGFSVVISCVVGMCIGYAGIATQALVSATSFMVLTNVNKFVVIAFGVVMLGDTGTPQSIVGCTVAILGGVWYAKVVSTAVKKAPEEEAPKADSPTWAETVGLAESEALSEESELITKTGEEAGQP